MQFLRMEDPIIGGSRPVAWLVGCYLASVPTPHPGEYGRSRSYLDNRCGN